MPETKNPPAGSQGGRASVSIRADAETLTKILTTPQPASAHQLRALKLIAEHHVRPALALALAGLAYGEPR